MTKVALNANTFLKSVFRVICAYLCKQPGEDAHIFEFMIW